MATEEPTAITEDLHTETLLQWIQEDPLVQTLAQYATDPAIPNLHAKGLIAGYDSLVAAASLALHQRTCLFILSDREEAAYFQSDLLNLLPEDQVLLFPTSYKKAYNVEETDNANVLRRAEVLNRLANRPKGQQLCIVSYPEAFSEKVINQRSLIQNTMSVRKGENLDPEFITELLLEYGFEKVDFVYEAGQFSVRGGIVDIFSFSQDLPYRVELFGDEVDSIRSFNPETQLSEEEKAAINILPNVQNKLLQEARECFLHFLPEGSLVWAKDLRMATEQLQRYWQKADEAYANLAEKSGEANVVTDPSQLYENPETFTEELKQFPLIEFGAIATFPEPKALAFQAKSQPSFNKQFELLADTLEQYQERDFRCVISAESEKQLRRLQNIFAEIRPGLGFIPFNRSLRQGFIDEETRLLCFTDHQIFERYHKYKSRERLNSSKALTLKELNTLKPGDYVTHIDHGVGRFTGLEKVEVNGKQQEAVRIIYKDNDSLLVSLHGLHKISRYSGQEGTAPAISKLGSQEWERKKRSAKKKVKDIAEELIRLYAKRRAAPGFAFSQDSYLQAELESSFVFEDTPDQAKATEATKADMEKPHPMDRLICGDVGFGKTEVAIRAAFKALNDSRQVAVLVPTTILALQHYNTFKQRLKDMPCRVDYLNRFRSTQESRQIAQDLADGKIDILIGTHSIVSKNMTWKDLGLLIVDEEQKFGVKVKDKLKELRVNVDTLTLTATPIPRTLQFSLMGARDLSVIETPPPNRQPVTTEMHTLSEDFIRDAVDFELRRGGQVFFVHNRVKDIYEVANIVLRLVPDAKVGVAHGQLESKRLEDAMLKFIEGDYDVLVSTNIVESGLDIPNANTIIINHAHMFGLSDLHQMRGRVGRSNRKAFCYLLIPSLASLTVEARKRLRALEEFSDLGDGFKVSMRDLDIRGAGNLLGGEQSGFITDLGFETYQKVLDDAIKELKENEFRDLFKINETQIDLSQLQTDCNLETDLEILIPEDYVQNISERLNLYNKLDNLEKEEDLQQFEASLRDRFGPLPEPVQSLVQTVRLRWLAEQTGIERMMLKNGNLKLHFVESENEAFYNSDVFGRVLEYVQSHPKSCQMRETKKRLVLTVESVDSVEQALSVMAAMRGEGETVSS